MRAISYRLSAISYGLLAIGYWLSGCGRNGNGVYEARGTVEVPEIDLAPLTSARVESIRVDEGAQVRAGDTLAVLRQIDLDATRSAARARIAEAEANLRDLEAGARPQEIRGAEAELAAAQAEADRAAKALERARSLVETNAIARQQYDDAVAAQQVAGERVTKAREALALARAGSRPERIQAARSEVASAKAALAQIEARAGGLVLTTPVTGIVLGRHAEPGENLGPNVPVLTIGETARPYVRVYVPQKLVSRLTTGTEVEVMPEDGRRIRGRVMAINPKAEFTPRVALTEQERADLMFGVKVEFVNPPEAPHPGLWVTVRIGGTEGRRAGGPAGRRASGPVGQWASGPERKRGRRVDE